MRESISLTLTLSRGERGSESNLLLIRRLT
jgi:hypothetical protein